MPTGRGEFGRSRGFKVQRRGAAANFPARGEEPTSGDQTKRACRDSGLRGVWGKGEAAPHKLEAKPFPSPLISPPCMHSLICLTQLCGRETAKTRTAACDPLVPLHACACKRQCL